MHRVPVGGIMLVERDNPLQGSGIRKEEALMPTYVVLMNWTDQGIKTANETVQRRDRADALAEKHGASIERVYWTVGPYDLVCVIEATDDESATAMLLELGAQGNLRTTTLRAYDREEMLGIIERLG
jgi:uncharacterized protein with GYD domain